MGGWGQKKKNQGTGQNSRTSALSHRRMREGSVRTVITTLPGGHRKVFHLPQDQAAYDEFRQLRRRRLSAGRQIAAESSANEGFVALPIDHSTESLLQMEPAVSDVQQRLPQFADEEEDSLPLHIRSTDEPIPIDRALAAPRDLETILPIEAKPVYGEAEEFFIEDKGLFRCQTMRMVDPTTGELISFQDPHTSEMVDFITSEEMLVPLDQMSDEQYRDYERWLANRPYEEEQQRLQAAVEAAAVAGVIEHAPEMVYRKDGLYEVYRATISLADGSEHESIRQRKLKNIEELTDEEMDEWVKTFTEQGHPDPRTYLPEVPENAKYSVMSSENPLGGQRYHFFDMLRKAFNCRWTLITYAHGQLDPEKDIPPGFRFHKSARDYTFKWATGSGMHCLYLDTDTKIGLRTFLEKTGLRFDTKNGGFPLAKRISRVMRPYFVCSTFKKGEINIHRMQFEKGSPEAAIWDGAGVVSRRALFKLLEKGMLGEMSDEKRKRLQMELRKSHRIEFTIMTARGQEKGHAMVCDGPIRDAQGNIILGENGKPVDFLVPHDIKEEVFFTVPGESLSTDILENGKAIQALERQLQGPLKKADRAVLFAEQSRLIQTQQALVRQQALERAENLGEEEDETWLGVNFIHGHEEMNIDEQNLTNLHPWLNPDSYRPFLRDRAIRLLRALETGNAKDAHLMLQPNATIEDIQRWPLMEFIARGGDIRNFPNFARQALRQHLRQIETMDNKLRMPVIGARLYVMPAAVGNAAGLGIKVERGQCKIDIKRGTIWVNNEDWVELQDNAPPRYQQEFNKDGSLKIDPKTGGPIQKDLTPHGIRGINGGADNDDAYWCIPWIDEAHPGKGVQIRGFRSPSQPGEFVDLIPTKDSDRITWKGLDVDESGNLVDVEIHHVSANSETSPLRIDHRNTEYHTGLVDSSANRAGQNLTIDRSMDSIAAVAKQNQTTLGMYCNLVGLATVLGIPIKLPCPMEEVIDNCVKWGADLSPVRKKIEQIYARIADQKIPIPRYVRDKRFIVKGYDRASHPITTDHWMDQITEQMLGDHRDYVDEMSDKILGNYRLDSRIVDAIMQDPESERWIDLGIQFNQVGGQKQGIARHNREVAARAARRAEGDPRNPDSDELVYDPDRDRGVHVGLGLVDDPDIDTPAGRDAYLERLKFLADFTYTDQVKIIRGAMVAGSLGTAKHGANKGAGYFTLGPKQPDGTRDDTIVRLTMAALHQDGVIGDLQEDESRKGQGWISVPNQNIQRTKAYIPITATYTWFNWYNQQQILRGRLPETDFRNVPKNAKTMFADHANNPYDTPIGGGLQPGLRHLEVYPDWADLPAKDGTKRSRVLRARTGQGPDPNGLDIIGRIPDDTPIRDNASMFVQFTRVDSEGDSRMYVELADEADILAPTIEYGALPFGGRQAEFLQARQAAAISDYEIGIQQPLSQDIDDQADTVSDAHMKQDNNSDPEMPANRGLLDLI